MGNLSICPRCHLPITLPESMWLDDLSHKMKIKTTFTWGEKLCMTPRFVCPGLACENPEKKCLQNSIKCCSVARIWDPQNFRASKQLFRKLLAFQDTQEAVPQAQLVAGCQHLLWNCHYREDKLYSHGMGEGRGRYHLWLMDREGKVSPHFLIDGVAGESWTPSRIRWVFTLRS